MSPQLPPTNATSGNFRWRIVTTVALVLSLAFGAYWLLRPDTAALILKAKREYLRGQHSAALETVSRVLKHDPELPAALNLAGDISFDLNRFDEALEFYRKVPDGSSAAAIHAQLRRGRIEMHYTRNADAAELNFRAALKHVPDDRNALFQLASLLGIQARRAEAVPFILRLFRQGTWQADFLPLLESKNGALFNVDELHRYRDATPDSPRVLVGLAWHARNSGSKDEALKIIERAKKADPKFEESRIVLAELLWEMKHIRELRALLAEVESMRVDDARLWDVRGKLAEYDGNSEGAARCFWEALRRDSTNHGAAYKLFRYFTDLKDEKTASHLQQRVEMLLELRSVSDLVASKQHADAAPMLRLVEQLEKVGSIWEAWGWCVVANDFDPEAKWAAPRAQSLHAKLKDAPLTLVGQAVDLGCDLSHLPEPTWQPGPNGDESVLASELTAATFRNDAESAGMIFRYFNSSGSPDAGQHMYEFNGGGCGVLDCDSDGWPDVLLTQGCRWESRGNQSEHLDRLFRNLGNGRFADVTRSAGIYENHFSTGTAVGDFDNDGFDDFYVSNIGGNRIFHNNGDGTFDDVTQLAAVDDPRWSTSSVIADLNGDTLPDIYSVSYLEGDSIFDEICHHDDGQPRMCMPFHFSAAQDQLYLSRGDGRFENATAESGIEVPNGKGLGVVAADWHGDGRISLFVANDTVANTFFVNRGNKADNAAIFEERGMPAGIAVNHTGRAEGCMGVAIGDVDEDGDLDVFVTNFLRESNTLYHSHPDLFFTDETQQSGLEEAGIPMLGFGTQFLDADLDGWLDLIVANGHIDDYRRYGRPYKMPAQFYRNNGHGRFLLQPDAQTGQYFTQKLLGRSLARWDWNRDGSNDVVISNLDQPAALLTNTTPKNGRYIAIRLKGVMSSRDAIGTVVTVNLGDRRISRQLTVGDGYQASNEHLLIFGLSDSKRVQQIDVTWPSNILQSFENPKADAEYVIVEGKDRMFRLDDRASGDRKTVR